MPDNLAAETQIHQRITDNSTEPDNYHIIEEETNIRLLEEKLVVDTNRQKIGEVIVRKVIETQMVQVPVRREKLIVEQIGSVNKQLAEIDLSQGEIAGIELAQNASYELPGWDGGLTVSGSFSSPKIASLLLNAIALERKHGCQQVRVSIVVEDEEHQKKYQEWFDRCSHGQLPKHEKSADT
ncbi:DUF2382 domain-containing protein [Nostoc parmelioides]|uniref:DUF2382 domain-containing protein n=1 Tax=Nostoc parmelioides FACHB-3921 TaxID=2692909 RepID=A0ABR8BKB1_9NOSO|nr:DUF2382 domain-containing protein [Nostoc parmelioides]MBD2254328.1 DUF2382 domain-containing protein [Nostoc parmelioides FACHB-3921]